MSESPKLSFILTTYNKIEYLKVILPLAIEALLSDEEIVVVDGKSSDGTGDYLKKLKDEGKIHQFISEKDSGEAHGINKAMILARGELLKIITDDDVYHFPAIQRCKSFMVSNPGIDVMGFDGYGVNRSMDSISFSPSCFIEGFKVWQKQKSPFLFSGLSLVIRKSSLSYLGLFNPSFKIVDMEYSMRISSLNSAIAFYSGMGFVNIVGPESNSVKFYRAIEEERIKVRKMYLPDEPVVTLSQRVKNVRSLLGGVKNRFMPKTVAKGPLSYPDVVSRSMKMLEESDRSHSWEILTGNV
ncbi:MAG: glycosyltransferase [Cytophagales bacterium]|nr:glycosyltransferase [Cytophagales bacterium]